MVLIWMGASLWIRGWQCIIPRQGLKSSLNHKWGQPDSSWTSRKGRFIGRTLGIQDAGTRADPKICDYCCSVTKSCLTLCDPMNCSTPGFPVHHLLPEFAQTYVHQVSDAIQPSHSLSSLSPPAFSLSQHQGLFYWVSSAHQVVKVLELQLQHQSLQWIFRTDFPSNGLVGTPYSPRDSQESSPTPQFKSVSC